jgi:DNA ligase (NAD+)
VASWAALLQNRDFLQRLKAAGITWSEIARQTAAAGPLTGTTLLITGTLESLRRSDAEEQLQALGAKIAPGMSKAVDYLVVGDSPGSKLDKARKLGTPICDEGWLRRVLEERRIPE